MMKKGKIKDLMIILLTIAITLAAIASLQAFFIDRDVSVRAVAKDERPTEVLLFGNSHMCNGISPMELYEDYGITSYNFGHSSEFSPQSYWLIRDAVERIHPKVVVLECFQANNGSKYYDTDTLHASMDVMQFSATKWSAAKDLVDDRNIRLEMMFPIGKYHGRWKNITTEDFYSDDDIPLNKGFVCFAEVYTGDFEKNEKLSGGDDGISTGEIYLSKIIEYCRENDTPIVLLYAPYPFCERESRKIAEYLRTHEPDTPFLDMTDRAEFNYDTDMHNENHLNHSGQLKLTKIIGDYLSENYDLTDYRNVATPWEDDLEEYIEYKADKLASRNTLYEYLMFLRDDDFYGELRLSNAAIIENDMLLKELTDNASDVKILGADETAPEGFGERKAHLTVYSKVTGELVMDEEFSFEED